MNESGPSYASLATKHDVEPERLIAVYDELDIAAGELRVKLGGGSSHNGVKSLQQAMRSREFLHVRIGIGRPPGRQDPADFVLASRSGSGSRPTSPSGSTERPTPCGASSPTGSRRRRIDSTVSRRSLRHGDIRLTGRIDLRPLHEDLLGPG